MLVKKWFLLILMCLSLSQMAQADEDTNYQDFLEYASSRCLRHFTGNEKLVKIYKSAIESGYFDYGRFLDGLESYDECGDESKVKTVIRSIRSEYSKRKREFLPGLFDEKRTRESYYNQWRRNRGSQFNRRILADIYLSGSFKDEPRIERVHEISIYNRTNDFIQKLVEVVYKKNFDDLSSSEFQGLVNQQETIFQTEKYVRERVFDHEEMFDIDFVSKIYETNLANSSNRVFNSALERLGSSKFLDADRKAEIAMKVSGRISQSNNYFERQSKLVDFVGFKKELIGSLVKFELSKQSTKYYSITKFLEDADVNLLVSLFSNGVADAYKDLIRNLIVEKYDFGNKSQYEVLKKYLERVSDEKLDTKSAVSQVIEVKFFRSSSRTLFELFFLSEFLEGDATINNYNFIVQSSRSERLKKVASKRRSQFFVSKSISELQEILYDASQSLVSRDVIFQTLASKDEFAKGTERQKILIRNVLQNVSDSELDGVLVEYLFDSTKVDPTDLEKILDEVAGRIASNRVRRQIFERLPITTKNFSIHIRISRGDLRISRSDLEKQIDSSREVKVLAKSLVTEDGPYNGRLAQRIRTVIGSKDGYAAQLILEYLERIIELGKIATQNGQQFFAPSGTKELVESLREVHLSKDVQEKLLYLLDYDNIPRENDRNRRFVRDIFYPGILSLAPSLDSGHQEEFVIYLNEMISYHLEPAFSGSDENEYDFDLNNFEGLYYEVCRHAQQNNLETVQEFCKVRLVEKISENSPRGWQFKLFQRLVQLNKAN